MNWLVRSSYQLVGQAGITNRVKCTTVVQVFKRPTSLKRFCIGRVNQVDLCF